MALDWTSLVLDASGQITIPTTFGGQAITTYLRTTLGREVTYQEGDATFHDVMHRNFTLTPNTGNTDTLTRILGGHPGTQVYLRPADATYTITLEPGANLYIPSGTLELSEIYHIVCFVCIAPDVYAKVLL